MVLCTIKSDQMAFLFSLSCSLSLFQSLTSNHNSCSPALSLHICVYLIFSFFFCLHFRSDLQLRHNYLTAVTQTYRYKEQS